MGASGSALGRRPAHIDPRIRERRIAVQRGIGRRRLQRLVDAALLAAVAAGFLAALRSPLLDVDEVQVRGNEHTAVDAVVEATGIARGDLLVDVDLQAAGERIAQLPWVRAVELHRGIDGAISVVVTERIPVAVVGVGSAAVLVDAEGRALARGTDDPALATALVAVDGVGRGLDPGEYLGSEASDALAVAARLGTVLDLSLRLSVAEGRLVGEVEPGIEVRFGDATQLDAKVRSLRTVLEQVDLTCAAVIDLRSPGSPVLTREEGCS